MLSTYSAGPSYLTELLVALGFLVVAAVFVAIFIASGRAQTLLSRRFQHMDQLIDEQIERMDPETSHEDFVSRVLRPLGMALGMAAQSRTPEEVFRQVQQQLITSGYAATMTPVEFIGLRLLMGFLFLGVWLFHAVMVPPHTIAWTLLDIVIAGLGFLAGYLLPRFALQAQMRRRQQQVLDALPFALDLLAIATDAGLSLDSALERVANNLTGTLGVELKYMMKEIRAGRSHREGLKNLAERIGLQDLRLFVTAVVQAEQVGSGIAETLKNQAEIMRMQQSYRAQEKALKIPVKMLFPMVIFIFPAIMIITVSPGVLRMIALFSHSHL